MEKICSQRLPIIPQVHETKTRRKEKKNFTIRISKCEIIIGPKSNLLSLQNDGKESKMEEKFVFNTDKNTHSIHLRRKISHLQFYPKLIVKRYVLQLVVCSAFLLNSEMKNAIYHRLINQSLVSVSYLRGSHSRYDINTNAIEQCV